MSLGGGTGSRHHLVRSVQLSAWDNDFRVLAGLLRLSEGHPSTGSAVLLQIRALGWPSSASACSCWAHTLIQGTF